MRPQSVNTPTQGQAAVLRVASELMFRGHRVAFPCVDDHGVDLYVDGFVRVQVKSAYLSFSIPPYRERGVYNFKLVGGWVAQNSRVVRRKRTRALSDESDFVVVMGIDEQRFWVLPSAVLDGITAFSAGPEGFYKRGEFSEAKHLRQQGLTQQQIADRLGVSQVAVSYQLRGGRTKKPSGRTAGLRAHEGRWDLIDQFVMTVAEANHLVSARRAPELAPTTE